ncbi:flavoprotein [Ethanoligenens harbinense]|uniref:Phosphopantothenoylcysteine decarboxylase n=1 Tax=Ethanoligenens harbinense (strain DSM 18485 / JCM 12961 / CGMCC 1.5033 / YUAN-3) TaxID=663278 RepID=E6U700_ETHHY|nr:phosphopantothenoylcysteine decarboxylase [Ethanoligenens harbinense]ADU26967.1 Phosphopantothenoylcysteine decarboxylase [Ethanoligenens harbinense YUAN-3]AVQ96057.1 phosphopantothenoylcysteine decarboxylase [Ethanoligenens harbinense YUAN-3]AYF38718.1 phosphopantothenoylcysteine decarboxylase [Ethanoligenens harbinense]AYF41465.1 phosphopantothenoylcysteine decarboxylase [Ethanoligenens harbinense]QCN92299.1 phosphopantothenoylcysteine decarboxylase [Ethanoligenens harbinense]
MKTILLGITGSIAAYKAAEIANRLTKDGYAVETIMTKGGCAFITPLTLQSLTKNRVYTDVFEEKYPHEIQHISLAQKTNLVLVAPASADIIGKAAGGIADDMLSTVLCAVSGVPVFFAPAMNTKMYENPIVQKNIQRLRRVGYQIIEPKESRLACGDTGKGAMADVDEIVQVVENVLQTES